MGQSTDIVSVEGVNLSQMSSNLDLNGPLPAEVSSQGRQKVKQLQSYATTIITGSVPGPTSGSQKPKQCGFCAGTGHTITGCQKLQLLGGRWLEDSDKAQLVNWLNSPTFAMPLPNGVVTSQKTLLDSLPPKTHFLVVHQQCYIDLLLPELGGRETPANLEVIITCLDNCGDEVPVLMEGGSFAKCFACASAVVEYILKHGRKGKKLKVISHLQDLPQVPTTQSAAKV